MRRLALLLLTLAAVILPAPPSQAHELRPAVLSLSELSAGRFAVEWTPPIAADNAAVRVEPRYPAHCNVTGRQLGCGEQGLVGTLAFDGLEDASVRVVVQIAWRDGSSRTEVLSAARSSLELYGVASDAGGGARLSLSMAYGTLGVAHILGGIDHVLFVLGLLFVVGFRRQLIWTVTAFTLAHSLTLALSVLGLVTLRRGPVEAVIALSILLVAAEALRHEASLTRRFPWAVAFAFGLLHGFGFAGALQEIGLPAGQLPLSLGTFNLGVELGQLLVIGLAYVLSQLAVRLPRLRDLRPVAVYAMGSVAAYWTIERVAALWSA